MDALNHIAVFIKVIENNGFSSAARELGVSTASVSKHVQKLEDHLGIRLLQRTTRRMTPTEEGRQYYERARLALNDLDDARCQVTEQAATPRGRLKINAPMSLGRQHLAPVIAQFAKLYPDVEMTIHFDDRMVDMISEGYDVVIRVGALEDSGLISKKLAPCPILPCASPAYVTEYGLPRTPKDLARHRFIAYSRQGRQGNWHYATPKGTRHHVSFTPVLHADTAEMLAEAALHGIGIAFLPIFTAAPYLENQSLFHLLPDYPTAPERALHVIYPQNRQLSRRVRLFVDHLAAWAEQSGGLFMLPV